VVVLFCSGACRSAGRSKSLSIPRTSPAGVGGRSQACRIPRRESLYLKAEPRLTEFEMRIGRHGRRCRDRRARGLFGFQVGLRTSGDAEAIICAAQIGVFPTPSSNADLTPGQLAIYNGDGSPTPSIFPKESGHLRLECRSELRKALRAGNGQAAP